MAPGLWGRYEDARTPCRLLGGRAHEGADRSAEDPFGRGYSRRPASSLVAPSVRRPGGRGLHALELKSNVPDRGAVAALLGFGSSKTAGFPRLSPLQRPEY